MLWVYVAAMVMAGGVLGLQLLLSHDGDGSSDTPHDADGALLPLFTSARFWTFAMLAFGLFGTLATLLGSSPTVVGVLALVVGIAAGAFAWWLVRRLGSRIAVAQAVVADAVGRVGKVVVALDGERLGKVRVQLSGEMHDLVARADERIEVGDAVLVEGFQGGVAVVSRAPRELQLGP